MAKDEQGNVAESAFHEWLDNLSEQFKKFTEEERNATLDHLLFASGHVQLQYLEQLIKRLLYRDFVLLLPPELREYVLSFLDGQSLLRCCKVNRFWNTTIGGSQRLWQLACQRSKFVVDTNDNFDCTKWKRFYVEMSRRQQQMKNRTAFKEWYNERDLRRVTALYYYKNKVASASDSRIIKIWNCSDNECIFSVRTDVSISCLKFDDHYVIGASYLGHIVTWDVETAERLAECVRHAGAIFSFDYSLDLNVVVSGAADSKIKIWALFDGRLYMTITDHATWVLKVLLTPYPAAHGSTSQDQHLLLSMDKSHISVRLMSCISEQNRPEGLYLTYFYNIPLKNMEIDTFISGMFFDGVFLHFVQNLEKNTIWFQWDLKNRRMVKQINLKRKVREVCAIGDKYIAVLLPPAQTQANFVVLDVDTQEAVVEWYLPRHRNSSPSCNHFCFGETSWLNGLDGKNDHGVLFALGTEENNVYVVKWVPRQ